MSLPLACEARPLGSAASQNRVRSILPAYWQSGCSLSFEIVELCHGLPCLDMASRRFGYAPRPMSPPRSAQKWVRLHPLAIRRIARSPNAHAETGTSASPRGEWPLLEAPICG